MDSTNFSINSKVFRCLRASFTGAEKKTDFPRTPFWTTVSPHDAFSAPLAHSDIQRAPNPPEFAQPRLSRAKGGHPQRDGTNLGVFVPIWPVITLV